jgi:hypothetical protein
MTKQILPLDPSQYQRHALHGDGRHWVETNCYVDLWIELLHALGHEPIAALAFTVAIDFEGDQWTFFKFPHADLYELFGLDVQELAIWRPMPAHLEEQVALGRPVLVEMDSYYLPDTAGTAYQREHVKSTIAVNAIDAAHQRLGYFHAQSYYELQGEDYEGVFQLNRPNDPSRLPPYVEFVKPRRARPLNEAELVRVSVQLLKRQLRLLPESNPFEKFKARFDADLSWLSGAALDTFHQYSFATLRQFGACYELASTYLQWLQRHDLPRLDGPMAAFTGLATGAKTMQFHLARAMARKKRLDLSAIDTMAERWRTAVTDLRTNFL